MTTGADGGTDERALLVPGAAQERITRDELLKRAAALSLSGSAVSALLASGGAPTALAASVAPQITRGGVLRVAEREGSPSDTLDPAKILTLIDSVRVNNLYDHLTRFAHDFSPKPNLATSWKASKDGKVWTFTLRPDALWHDGKPVTAQDVVFTFKRLTNPSTGATQQLPFKFANINALDSHTVRFSLQQGYFDMPYVLAGDFTAIMRTDFDPKKVNVAPVASGPFKFSSFTPGQASSFVRFDGYWRKGYPFLDGLNVLNIFDETARNNGLAAGQIDFSTSIDFSSIDIIKANKGQIFDLPGGAYVSVVALVNGPGATGKQLVRQALAYSIDRPEIVKKVFRGLARVGNDQPIAPTLPNAPKGIPQRTRDIKKAKALLAKAGYPDGVDVTLITSDAVFGMKDVALVVAEQAKDAGFRIKIQEWPTQTYWSQVWLKKPFYMTGVTGRPTPDIMLTLVFYSYDETHYKNPIFDRLVQQARSVGDPHQRQQIYSQACRMVWEAAGYILPAFVDMVHGARNNVHFQELPPPIGHIRFTEAWLS
jgi:peptide/nickel transport system substrate-binding protein